jgi:hypothetical protein
MSLWQCVSPYPTLRCPCGSVSVPIQPLAVPVAVFQSLYSPSLSPWQCVSPYTALRCPCRSVSIPLQPFAVPVAVCQSLSSHSLSLWQCVSPSPALRCPCRSVSIPLQPFAVPADSHPTNCQYQTVRLYTGCSNNVPFCHHWYNCQLMQQAAVSRSVAPRVTTCHHVQSCHLHNPTSLSVPGSLCAC